MINREEKCILSYEGEYKISFLRRFPMKLSIYPSYIFCEGFQLKNDILTDSTRIAEIEYESLSNVDISTINNTPCILINYKYESYFGNSFQETMVLFDLGDLKKCIDEINKCKTKLLNYLQAQQQLKINKIETEKKATEFYQKCYNYHIKDKTPNYTFFEDKNTIALIYIDKDKGLNFLKIDGYNEEESLGVIPYDKIHYYEKAGNIHYVSEINGKFSSYGGSFTGANFSKLAAVGGGLIFGTIGMTAGALLTYKPSQQQPSNNTFDISSETKKIDERNVILNFYSDEKQQYIDLELPQNIYNFMQTHLPLKKYAIVTEVEKQTAIQQSLNKQPLIEQNEAPKILTQTDSLNDFKIRVEKLKLMKEAGLLTNEEFDNEKLKLLSSI